MLTRPNSSQKNFVEKNQLSPYHLPQLLLGANTNSERQWSLFMTSLQG